MKEIKWHTKNILSNFRKRVLEIWLKECNSYVIAFTETNTSQVNGEWNFKYKEWKSAIIQNKYPPCSSKAELMISN